MRNKRAKKVLAIFAGTIATILLSMMALSAIYEDELVNYLKDKINNSLITPLNIEKTSVSIFDDFPSISIKLTNLSLNDTLNNRPFEVIKARQVVFSFDLISLLRKKILMKSASATDVVFNHLIDKNGEKHSVKFKTIKDKSGAALDISIPKITLTNVKIHITNEFKEKEAIILIEKGKTAIHFKNGRGIITPSVKGKLIVFNLNNIEFLKSENLEAHGNIKLSKSGKIIEFENCVGKMAGLDWSIAGSITKIGNNAGAFHHLKINAIGNGILFLKSLLPEGFKNDDFQTGKGKTDLTITNFGYVSPKIKPASTLKLNIKNGSFNSTERQSEFKNIEVDLFMDNSDSTVNKTFLKTTLNAYFKDINVQNLPKAYFNFWEKIVKINEAKKNSTQEVMPTQNEISANIKFQIGKISYLNAIANNVSTEVNINNGILNLNNFKGEAFNGTINFNASFRELSNNLQASINGNLTQVDIPKAFYGFNNFGQKLIQSKNIKGKLNQDFQIETQLDEKMIPIMAKTSFIGKTELLKSELIQWEPLMKVFQYIGKDKVSNLLIDTCEINMVLFNNTVYLYPFEVNSSITKFNIAGKQGLDKTNELYFQFNLADQLMIRSKKKRSNFKAGIESDRNWGNIFVKLTGKEGNYTPEFLSKEKYQIEIKKTTKEYLLAKRKVENFKRK